MSVSMIYLLHSTFYFFIVLIISIYWWIREYSFNGAISHNHGLKQFVTQPKGEKNHNLMNFEVPF